MASRRNVNPNISLSFIDEADLETRIQTLQTRFQEIFGQVAERISRAPGRAEILGCHTDYNYGFSLAAGISRSTLALGTKRTDNYIRVYSTAFPQFTAEFEIGDRNRDEQNTWTNYPKAVVAFLKNQSYSIRGANILIDSTVPKSGGVSSSAAFELAVARVLLALYDQPYNALTIARLCQIAENSDIVQSPCGFLDQGSSAMAKRGNLVFFDFLPTNNSPVSKVDTIPIDIERHNSAFVIVVDSKLERQLGATGYVVRRQMCEQSLPFWSDVLGREIHSLREVSVEEFEQHKNALEEKNPTMRMRVEHVVYENQRVLDAVHVLENDDIEAFGKYLTESGKSALELYELDENTPQLTHIVTIGRTLPGVVGLRNKGGGFSAIALALVKKDALLEFKQRLADSYKDNFGRELSFIEFRTTEGAEILM
jgi:galactokinase